MCQSKATVEPKNGKKTIQCQQYLSMSGVVTAPC